MRFLAVNQRSLGGPPPVGRTPACPGLARTILYAVTAFRLGSGQPVSAADPEGALPETIRFNRDIRPILSDNCYFCHGPDRNKRKAKLRVDTAEGLRGDPAGSGPVVPGRPDRSELYHRITTTDPDDRMPAPGSGKTLTPHQIALIQRWIEQGASWEGHWAYLPPHRPPVPEVSRSDWARNPLDRFILARLERESIAPSPEADRRTRLRRLAFDLTGLPPVAVGIDEEAAEQPEAYEQWVDRLLGSPHFGERLAMVWLDLVRYADTDGYHGDNYRSVWPYRDYVIRAFNENMPFDRFTREQLAGDLLPAQDSQPKIASTYNRLGRTTEEGGAQAKEYLAKYAADRVRTTATGWLGSTLACAQCHDHKFDPFTTRDFYRMGAFFADIKEQGVGKPEEIPVPNAEQAAERQRLADRRRDLEQQLQRPTPELAAGQARWEAGLRADLAASRLGWEIVRPVRLAADQGTTLKHLDDASVLAEGDNPDNDNYRIALPTDREHLTALRLEVLTHPSLTRGSLSRANGNFVLSELELKVAAPGETNGQRVAFGAALADFSQEHYPVQAAIDGKTDTGWAVDGHNQATNRQAVFLFASPLAGGPGTTLNVTLSHQSQFKQHNIGRFRLALTSVDHPGLGTNALPDNILAIVRLDPEQRRPEQQQTLAAHYRRIAPELEPVREQIAATQRKQKELETTMPKTLATVRVAPRVMRVLPRGNWQDDSGPVVAPGVPEFLPAPQVPSQGATRLDLANWLVARENPLTARVFVNRLWALFFGTGISRTLDDFGAQGEWPVNPELLDWLAVEFMESGWDIKHLVRLMVTSSTYRQSSTLRAELRERDPGNRWLARQSRFRLPAEMVRDNALAVSGLLVDTIGGPSVKPYQPAGYWAQLNFPKREWKPDQGEALYRRGLYVFWCRTFLHPSLLAFDAPSREECTAQRNTSNTPQQALTLLNDPEFVEAARVLAERILRQGGPTVEDRLRWTFRRVLSRPPHADELRLLEELLHHERARYQADPPAARTLVGTGAWPVPDNLDATELAAWTSIARVTLNLHETIERF